MELWTIIIYYLFLCVAVILTISWVTDFSKLYSLLWKQVYLQKALESGSWGFGNGVVEEERVV